MKFWAIMFFSVLVTPAMMLLVGWWYRDRAPKQINRICGYRTPMSMKNADTWLFAQEKMGRTWLRWGKWMFLTVFPVLFAVGQTENTVSTAGILVILVQIVLIIASIWPVEKALRETFDEDGYRRT